MIDWYYGNIVLLEGTLLSFLLALSIQLPLRMGVFSFAGIAAYGVGAYSTAIVSLRLNWPPVLAVGTGVVIAAVGAAILALVVRRLAGMYLAMATLAVILIVQVVVQNGGELTGGALGLYGIITNVSFVHLLLVSAAIAAVLAFTEAGQLSRRIDAVREDRELATSMGVNVYGYRLAAAVSSAVLGAIAGGFEALLRTTVTPRSIGFGLLITALTVVIIGGFNSWIGALIGAVFVTWLPIILQGVERYQHLVYGTLVVLAAIFFPHGILGILRQLYRKLTRRGFDREVDESAESAGAEAAGTAADLGQVGRVGSS